jgi:hypothetical protein
MGWRSVFYIWKEFLEGWDGHCHGCVSGYGT